MQTKTQNRKRKVMVYLSEEEYQELKQYCTNNSLPMAVFLRSKGLETIRKTT